MAKQSGPVYITGTVAGICYYRLDGKYYTRRKSSLSRKRVKRDPRFARTRKYAELLGQASRVAAGVYRLLPRNKKRLALYRAMTGQAMTMLKRGAGEAEVREWLEREAAKTLKPAVQQPPVVRMRAVAGSMNVVRTAWRSHGKGMHYGKALSKRRTPVWTVMTRECTYLVRLGDVRYSSS